MNHNGAYLYTVLTLKVILIQIHVHKLIEKYYTDTQKTKIRSYNALKKIESHITHKVKDISKRGRTILCEYFYR
jgi:hypothetical protein